ncbi:MAG: 3-methyl-2-oxobutanoate hydroxymethyltransferase [Candidatus Eiseniibacteriota bacterium]|nr:MAG: 3-methyl-2-oxobutanoate hydroxymethyltransferase [Candidatus Eisenbacteria bacterium]
MKSERKKVTVATIAKMKQGGEKIAVLTAYDFPTATLADEAGVDIILVGDSLGMVVLGYENTLSVTMSEMLHHASAVTRARPRALVVGDMPFMSFQESRERAARNAGRFVKKAGVDAVKIEGGEAMADTVRYIVGASIPVMGHIGLTPQSILRFGGYKVQGKKSEEAEQLVRDAKALEEAGCFAVVLEGIPWRLAQRITSEINVPTIGIGAGPHCSGQVLVLHDVIGLFSKYAPRFVKRYVEAGDLIRDAFSRYVSEVKEGKFPTLEYSYGE